VTDGASIWLRDATWRQLSSLASNWRRTSNPTS